MALTSKKNNRTCIVCGTQYYHCGHCDEPIKPAWYAIFHDQNCHDIYDTVANILPQKGKEAAKKALDKLDLSNKDNFHQNIIKLINEIYDIKDENKVEENKMEGTKVDEVKMNELVKENKETITSTTTSTITVTDVKVEEEKSVKTDTVKTTSTKAKVVNKNKK